MWLVGAPFDAGNSAQISEHFWKETVNSPPVELCVYHWSAAGGRGVLSGYV